MGMGPVLVSYMRTLGEAGVAAWEMLIGSTGLVEAGGSRVPWSRDGGLARCREDELWPPRVFSIAAS